MWARARRAASNASAGASADTPSAATGTGTATGTCGAADSGGGSSRASRVRSFGSVLRAHPYTWLVPLAVAAILVGLGILGVLMAAKSDEDQARLVAQAVGATTAAGIHVMVESVISPLLALATRVIEDPQFDQLHTWFYSDAQRLLQHVPKTVSVKLVLLAPQAVISYVYPRDGNEDLIGIDNLRVPSRRPWALRAIERGNLSMQGPLAVPADGGYNAILFRFPVFIQNVTNATETFGFPSAAYDCPPCYNPRTKSRFWGFATVYVDADSLADVSDAGSDTRLRRFDALGYSYQLLAPQPNGGEAVLAASAVPPADAVETRVTTPSDLPWRLLLAPASGWAPPWRAPMLAAAAALGAAVGALTCLILVSRRRLLRAVSTLKRTNAELADEKRRMDVLLARQLNLIACALGQRGGGGSGGITSGSGGAAPSGPRSGGSGEGKALEEEAMAHIEDLRRHLAGPGAASGACDDLELLELLGEGAFGKVYKGTWRGSVVAIKVMILPARMSGKEKRERMALMEAAISSAMHHPNIVQTYTYTIQPATSSYSPAIDKDEAIGAFSMRRRRPAVGSQSSSDATTPSLSASSRVHNYEVCLVLEFCEMGSLRDALDHGAFFLDEERRRVNYAAVLDAAADVARALLHLHKQQIIHADLKARNVLLKADGRAGRGFVAKVADFGLSLKMDSHVTHLSEFQGTISHMAPETQLERRITTASDLYAFGITLWELYTGGQAFAGVPILLLAHKVSEQGQRPAFPIDAPPEYRRLAEACWARDPADRPAFGDVLARLVEMRKQLGGATPPLRPYAPIWEDSAPAEEEGGLLGGSLGAFPVPPADDGRYFIPVPIPEGDEDDDAAAAAGGAGGGSGSRSPPAPRPPPPSLDAGGSAAAALGGAGGVGASTAAGESVGPGGAAGEGEGGAGAGPSAQDAAAAAEAMERGEPPPTWRV